MPYSLADYRNALAGVESAGSGGYSALGPVMPKTGDRAYGRYQVMGNNIPSWTQAALGAPMNPQQFLQSPQAQDAVFDHRFGGYLNQYGNPQDAASMWFSGRPLYRAGNASDGYITAPEYVRRFNSFLGGQGNPQMANPSQPAMPAAFAAAAPPMQQAMQQPAQTAPPLQTAGDTLQRMAMWGMAIKDPSVLGALGQTNPARKFVQIGADSLGNPRYGFVDERAGTVTPANTAGANGAQAGEMGDQITNAINSGAHGEELLKSVNPVLANQVRLIASGASNFSESTMMRTPQGRGVLALLNQYEPGFTAADYQGRAAGMRDWATKSNDLVRRGSQVVMHGSHLVDAFPQTYSGPIPAANAVGNLLSTATGGAGPQSVQRLVTAASNEMGAFVRGNGGSDQSFKEWASGFPVNGSMAQKQAAVGDLANLWQDSMHELEQKRIRAVGAANAQRMGPLLDPKASAALAKMQAFAAGGANGQPQAQAQPSAPTISNIRQIK